MWRLATGLAWKEMKFHVLYSYLKEDVLYAQSLFVHGFYDRFFDRHLQ